MLLQQHPVLDVAPRAGAGIEIELSDRTGDPIESPLAQGRELKLKTLGTKAFAQCRPSRRGGN